MDDPADLERTSRAAPHARRTTRTLLAIVVGGALALGLVLGGTIVWHRLHALPEVTEQGYRAAREKWEASGPASYELTVKLSGNWDDTYHVVVRQGRVEEMTYNGLPMEKPRTQEVWTVPGMFGTIAEDLARCARQRRAAEDPAAAGELTEPKLVVRARFDEQYGYPAEYLRIELGGQTNVSWQVTEFTVLEDVRPEAEELP